MNEEIIKLNSEVRELQDLIVLIRYRLRELTTHRLFVPSYEVDFVAQLVDRNIEIWLDGE